MRVTTGPALGLLSLLFLATPTIAQNNRPPTDDLPDLATITQTDGGDITNEPTTAATATGRTTTREDEKEEPEETRSATTSNTRDARPTRSLSSFIVTETPESSSSQSSTTSEDSSTSTGTRTSLAPFHLSDLPTIAGVGIPSVGVPDTHAAPFMQKSNLPDGTVFICVGAALGGLGAAILIWRALVAWALHRSVKRAAMAQNLADLKAMSANPIKKRGAFYNAVGANSNMSLDRLSAAPTGTSKPPKPFASGPGGTPPNKPSLFYSPTGANAAHRNSDRPSSNYLPAGYYPTAAGSSPITHAHAAHSSLSLAAPTNRFSTRSGISPPASPSLPPSRGPGGTYDRAPPSRGNDSLYNRNSIATLGNNPGVGAGVYGAGGPSQSNLSLNVPGGTHVAGGRAPSAYLEDLFESHGNAMGTGPANGGGAGSRF